MPKSLMVDPAAVRASGQINFEPIPINQYKRSIREELEFFTKDDLKRIYRDMVIIRAFENMLNEIKLRGNFKGIEYDHRGPAHLSLGQEASAVGQAYLLRRQRMADARRRLAQRRLRDGRSGRRGQGGSAESGRHEDQQTDKPDCAKQPLPPAAGECRSDFRQVGSRQSAQPEGDSPEVDLHEGREEGE